MRADIKSQLVGVTGVVKGTVEQTHFRQNAVALTTEDGDTVVLRLPWSVSLPEPGYRCWFKWRIQTNNYFEPEVQVYDWTLVGRVG